jgi:hypothetical protein
VLEQLLCAERYLCLFALARTSAQKNSSISAQRIPEGYCLSDRAYQYKESLWLGVIGIFWTGSSLLALAGFCADFCRSLNVVSLGFGLFVIPFLSIFVLIGLAILATSGLSFWVAYRLHPAELILPAYPLKLGQRYEIHYRRRLRNGTLRKSAPLQAKFICDEWVQYSQGTDTMTKTHVLLEQPLPEHNWVCGESQTDYRASIEIPAQGPPSFKANHNQIRWQLEVKLKIPGIPTVCASTFDLLVLPSTA